MRSMKKAAVTAACLILSGCRTMADYNFSSIDTNIASGDYAAVRSELETSSHLYSDHDEVLRELDLGLVSHYAVQSDQSNKDLSAAERLIEEKYTKSVSQKVASWLTNDTVEDYAGESFEDIYTNIFMALNYLELGNTDDAMVEIRRFDNKLKSLGARYDAEIAATESGTSGQQVKRVAINFHDSALARYLSMLLYRTSGDRDNARIDYRYLQEAYRTQEQLYPFSEPSSAAGELAVPKGQGRLSVLCFSGLAPVKHEEVTRVWSWDGRIMYKLALPVMTMRPSVITGARVTAVDSNGQRYSADTEKLESLERISVDTFQQKASLLYTKALIRSIAKAAANSTFSALADDKNNTTGTAALFSLLEVASKVTNEVSERADVRTCRYFPATASVAGLTLPPGTYTVTIDFFGTNKIESTSTRTVTVTADGLNLVEASCLR
jgi:uncharacterized protein